MPSTDISLIYMDCYGITVLLDNTMFFAVQQAARKSAPTTGGVKKPHRYRPGTVALRCVSF